MNPDAFRVLPSTDEAMMEALRRRQQGRGFEPSALIAEGGGMAGVLAGGATGAAIGSVVPGIGTLIGGLIGAGVGGFAGGFGGSAVEQKVRDGKIDWGKAAKTGAIEGVTAAGPIKILKAGKAAYTATKSGKAVVPAVEEAVNNTLLKRMSTRAGKSLEETGGKLMNSQTNLTRATMRQIGANTPEMFMKMNSKYGLTKLDDVAAVSRNVTGQDGVHSESVRNILFSGPGIETSDLRTSLPALLDSKAPLVDAGTRKRIQSQVDNAIQSMYADQPLNPLANPGAAFDISRDFRGQARDLRRGANPSGAEKQLAKVYDELASNIEKKLYSQPGIEQAFPLVRDNMVKTYQTLASQATGAQRKAYTKLAQEASQMKTISELRSAQRIWVEAAQVDQKTAEASGNAAANMAGGGSILSGIRNGILGAANPYVGSAAARTGRVLADKGPLLDKLNTPVTRAATGAVAANLLTSGQPQAQPESTLMPPPSNNNAAFTSPQDLLSSSAQPQEIPQPTQPVDINALAATLARSTDPQEIASALNMFFPQQQGEDEYARRLKMDMLLSGGQNADMLKEIYGGNTQDLSSNQQKQIMGADNANMLVDQIEAELSKIPAGYFPGGTASLLGRFQAGGASGDQAKSYNDARSSMALSLIKAIQGSAGNISDADRKAIENAIPAATDSEGVRANKLRFLRNKIAAAQESALGGSSQSIGSVNSLLAQMNGI